MTEHKNKGKLFMIPVPVADGTAEKVLTPQTREVVSSTRFYLVENLRTARRFIGSLRTGVVIDDLSFFELDKRTSEKELREFFREVPEDEDVGVMSEAGCPGIADPGALAASFAHGSGREVVPLAGPSAILLALMASGLSGQSFCFHGYLPVDRPGRIREVKRLEKQAAAGQTQIFMETPYRNNHLIKDVLEHCSPGTSFCIASEVTGPGQYIRTQRIAEWRKTGLPDLHKKPTVFLLG